MGTSAVFPKAPARAGMYESFFLRAVSPEEPVGVWIRHTVHKRRGERPTGSAWCTVFDSRRGRPYMHKQIGREPSVPAGGWIDVGHARMTPREAEGTCGAARWSLRFASDEPELLHLPRRWLYRTPLPRTKLSSPLPAARFDGSLEVSGQSVIELHGWRGMVGHNWGSEHAERWIWLHGVGFGEEPEAWLDVALGRVRVAGRMTPWVANGALSLDGRRYRVGGLTAGRPDVAETSRGCMVAFGGERRLALQARVEVPEGAAACWHYAGPDGEDRSGAHSQDGWIGGAPDPAPLDGVSPPAGTQSEGLGRAVCTGGRDVINCSVSALKLIVRLPGEGEARTLRTAHGAAYELGVRRYDQRLGREREPAQP